jgi:hypothetical protein
MKLVEMLEGCVGSIEEKVVVGMVLGREEVGVDELKEGKEWYESKYGGRVDYRLIMELDKRGELDKSVSEYKVLV